MAKKSSDNRVRLDARRAEAVLLAASSRGQYLMCRALTMAIRELERVEPAYRDHSDIEQMRLIRDMLYRDHVEIERAVDRAMELLEGSRDDSS